MDASFPLCCYLTAVQQDLQEMRFICTLIFLTAASRLLMDCLALVVSRTYSCGPTGIHIFEYLKSCYLIVWIPIILHLDAD